MSLLEIDSLTVAFGDRPVVHDVSFSIEAGEKFALVGESGSGKSVTAQSILRLLPTLMQGEIRFQNQNLLALPEPRMRAVRGKQISMIFQEPMTALNPLMTIGKQITEMLELHEGLRFPAARQRAINLLERTGIPEPQRRFNSYPHELSGGQRQRAMIAMALSCRPKLLIADEPTTALDVTLRVQIMDLLEELQQEFGMAIMLITHDLSLVQRFAQRVGVMQNGHLVELADTANLFAQPQHEYTKRLLNSRPSLMIDTHPELNEIVLHAQNVTVEFNYRNGWFNKQIFRAVDSANVEIRRSETLGIVGESGSGKTTLAMALLKLQEKTKGTVVFVGKNLDALARHDLRKLRAAFQVVFQDPYSSLSPRMTIAQIIGEGLALHRPDLDTNAKHELILQTLQEVGLNADSLYRYPHEFSGGQRQRIAIARVIILQPKLIVLDEPTSALDVSVQKQILELLVQLQQKYAISYLFISHDLAVVRAISHRVMVMRAGEIVEQGPAEEVFQNPRQTYTQKLVAAALH